MSDVVLLRKLTRKSVLNFGQNEGRSIQQLLDLKDQNYLRWVYYNCSNINFFTDILDELKITGDFIIEKPSKNPEMYLKLKEHIFECLSQDYKEMTIKNKEKRNKKIILAKTVRASKVDKIKFSSKSMTRKNHGHK
jgi:hypothetical protein